jgi:hypothetical protein
MEKLRILLIGAAVMARQITLAPRCGKERGPYTESH